MPRRRRHLHQLAGPIEEQLDRRLDEYLHTRAATVLQDSYAGLAMLKFPEDLRVYEQLIWDMRADTVIEIGTYGGGSALWFRDRLRAQRAYARTTAAPLVISIDLYAEAAESTLRSADISFDQEIVLVQGDVTDPQLPERVAALLDSERRALVVDDSAHTYDTTLAALRGFSRFVAPGGWFVVEDGVVDVERVRAPGWPRGVLPAIDDWLTSPEGASFRRRRDVERYLVTCHPGGWLQRSE